MDAAGRGNHGKNIKVDVAVIGAGTAGLSARHYAAKAGAKTLMIDPGPLGTTCARVGCMPSKLLIAASDAAHAARHAGVYGVRARVSVDTAQVMKVVRTGRDYFVGSMMVEYRKLLKNKLLLRERALFTGPRTLRAGENTVEFKAAVIATGSVNVVPEPYRAYPGFLLSRENIFELKRLPASVLVVGAGLIGLELGQALARLGTRVTVLGLDRLAGPLTDPELREEAIKLFSEEFEFCPQHSLTGLKREGKLLRVSYRDAAGKARTGTFEKVLMAAGQRPALDGLGLEAAGIPPDGRGRLLADPATMRVGHSRIFIAGDADPFRPALHEAAFEGELAGRNAASWPRVTSAARYPQMAITFTDPQLAVAGAARKELKPGSFCCGELEYKSQGRARIMNAGRGRLRVYGEKRSGKLLGAEIVGPRAEHAAHLLAWCIGRGLTVADLLRLPVYHPVLEEGLSEALEDLSAKLRGRGGCACGKKAPGA
ncbi:MAG: dihydrolipoyl dehydrogenase [Elusimicrobia bacterium GWB2_63_22]|nr:MAG: dihydrolipoyl dehydrogenase [Elusimicrobia bacterium GWB2_63_22]